MRSKERSYDYQAPTYEDTVDRAERKGSMFDMVLKDAKFYRPKQGVNLLRILPPGWKGARHYGFPIRVHRGVGPNDRQYLCLRENEGSPYKRCPVCEALYDLGAKATQQDKMDLRPGISMIYYVIDRDNAKDGVQVWTSSSTTDSEIAAQSVNRRSKSVLDIAHPDHGYDLEFTRTGTTRNNTRYRGFQVMREPSPLSDSERLMDEWLDVAFDKPLPSLLQFFKPEHVEEVFYGRAKEGEDERPRRETSADEDEPRTPLRRTRNRDEDEDDDRGKRRPARAEAGDDEDEDPEERRPRHSTAVERKGSSDDGEADERPARQGRTRLSGDLDDEIPSDAGRRGRNNGRDDEEAEAPRSRGAARRERPTRVDESAETDGHAETRPTRARRAAESDDEEDDGSDRVRRGSAAASQDVTVDQHEEQRRRMRERLDRGRD